MKHIALSTLFLATSLTTLIACGDNQPPAPEPYPHSCGEIASTDAKLPDGDYDLFIDNDPGKPWTAYCADMRSDAPAEYLTLPRGSSGNYSQYTAGGASPGTSVNTGFEKVRIDPESLALDTADQRFAISTGVVAHMGGAAVQALPLGVAMTCGGGWSNGGIDLTGTRFFVDKSQFAFVTADPAGFGGVDVYANGQVVSLYGDGNCSWSAPIGPDPMKPAGLALQLTYR